MPPGRERASAMNSCRFFASTEGFVIMTFGTVATRQIGVRSLTGS